MINMKRITWINGVQIAAPFVAVIFFAGIAQSTVNANTKTNDEHSDRISTLEKELAGTRSDYKYILRALQRLEEKIDKQ